MNQTLRLLDHIEIFNELGILEDNFKTASEENITTIDELCDLFDEEISYLVGEADK